MSEPLRVPWLPEDVVRSKGYKRGLAAGSKRAKAKPRPPWSHGASAERGYRRTFSPFGDTTPQEYRDPMPKPPKKTATPAKPRVTRKKVSPPPAGDATMPPAQPRHLRVVPNGMGPGELAPDGETPPALVQRPDVVDAVTTGRWLSLVPHASQQDAVDALVVAVTLTLAEIGDATPAWSDVLRQADVSWVAWIAMRDTPPGQLVWQLWGAMLADQTLLQARQAVRQAVDRDSAAAAREKRELAKWIAERMDRMFSDTATGNQRAGNVTIIVQNELPPPRP